MLKFLNNYEAEKRIQAYRRWPNGQRHGLERASCVPHRVGGPGDSCFYCERWRLGFVVTRWDFIWNCESMYIIYIELWCLFAIFSLAVHSGSPQLVGFFGWSLAAGGTMALYAAIAFGRRTSGSGDVVRRCMRCSNLSGLWMFFWFCWRHFNQSMSDMYCKC